MHRYRPLVLFSSLLTFTLAFSAARAPAATPAFTITATNVTLSSSTSSGVGSSSFTLTSVNGYTGSVFVGCDPPTPPAGVKLPYCGSGSSGTGAVPIQPPITLTADEVVTGTIPFYNSRLPAPFSALHRRDRGMAPSLALAGALLLGFGFRRRRARWLALALYTLFALAGISACGGNNDYVTPGTYAYTVAATDVDTSATVTATFNVTVP
ncbi:MAG: hypothetical protein WBE72_07695 [Terracidiphilus sp.]